MKFKYPIHNLNFGISYESKKSMKLNEESYNQLETNYFDYYFESEDTVLQNAISSTAKTVAEYKIISPSKLSIGSSFFYKKFGFITADELYSYGQNETFLPGHPVINKEKGIEFTNGSLGMGLAVGIGNAIAAKKKNLSSRSYVLMGDGECNEGSVWEAVMAAPHFKLDNLTAIIDRNRLQQTGVGSDIMDTGDLREKFSSFGWYAVEINGHDVTDIYKALNEDTGGKPKAIVAQTIKGKGFSFSEGNNSWHHAVLTKKLYSLGLTECGGDSNADN